MKTRYNWKDRYAAHQGRDTRRRPQGQSFRLIPHSDGIGPERMTRLTRAENVVTLCVAVIGIAALVGCVRVAAAIVQSRDSLARIEAQMRAERE